ncbi:HNH endonuclease signature motif containing protein [Candidatus Mycobacterium wuenschmannii]|uniref:HNH endonuclease signature motif containing protein n=1 Tax=Candidatus Mycobacterium wuenschmannii TaxID=3027808 RepID=A0ABY8VU22_9MYCO|nr:HNH endonuclease signature motif containing protein [Candidatus Mycobacterium wuenschmannii]WIM86530.1 HNH endonuclease signature motif containing protein [Candidatus Mycobacterium wuenschmannii]
MRSSSRDEVVGVLDALEAGYKAALDLSFDALTTPERLAVLERFETFRRMQPAIEHALLTELARVEPAVLGGKLAPVLADRLRITRAEASRRMHEAEDLGERTALNGEPLPPVLEATAAAQRNGHVGAGHIAVIRSFWQRIPDFVDVETRGIAEAKLADLSLQHWPDELAKLADKLMDCLNPDGDFTDVDRAKRRGVTIGKQDIDGMSKVTGYLTPEARATWDTVFAKLAAPGMCNPDDDVPCVSGTPSEAQIQGDTRGPAQRTHDALLAAGRALLASGDLGQHNGLPASIIVTTTLQELENGAGRGLTSGGTLLPMSDVIRLGSHAHHYLAIFDNGKALALYHTKRLATPAQRLVLHARDRGCTFPGCPTPADRCEVHHDDPYRNNPVTDVNTLTLACHPNHEMTEKGWKTRKNHRYETEWIPPPHLDHGQSRINTYHHPEKLLRDSDDDEAP